MTLLELMLATAILGIALVALGVAVARGVKGLTLADRVDGASEVAHWRWQQWRLQRRASTDEARIGSENGERMFGGRLYSWQNEVAATDDPDRMEWRLVVRWKDGGREDERRFVCLIPRQAGRFW